MQLAIEMVVVVVGELVQQPTVRLARATVVAHQCIPGQPLHQPVERLEDLGADRAIELAPQAVQDDRRMVARHAHQPLVFDRRLAAKKRAGLRQPHRQLDPQQHPQLVGQVEIVLRRKPQAQLDAVVPQLPEPLEVGPHPRRPRIAMQRVGIPAPREHHPRVDRPPVKQHRRTVHSERAQAEAHRPLIAIRNAQPRLVERGPVWRPGLRMGDHDLEPGTILGCSAASVARLFCACSVGDNQRPGRIVQLQGHQARR